MKLSKKKYAKEVQLLCDKLFKESELVRLATNRTLGREHVACYLKNLEVLFASNIATINEARFHHAGTAFAKVFEEKWHEEKGHDEWARKDLKSFSESVSIVPELKEFTDFLHKSMVHTPKNYIFYFYYAEFLTSYLGPKWMNLMNHSLGIKPSEVTALSKHVELDVGHAEEMLDVLFTFDWTSQELENLTSYTSSLHEYYSKLFNAISRAGNDKGTVKQFSSAS